MKKNKLNTKLVLVLVTVCIMVASLVRSTINDILAINVEPNSFEEVETEVNDKVEGSFEVSEVVAAVEEVVVSDEVEEELETTDAVEEVVPTFEELPIEEKIRVKCEEYGVDFKIALAIARLETGWFKSDAYIHRNNPGGLSRNEKPIAFATIEDGVEAFVGNLARGYFGQGLNTPETIGRKYCPVDPSWASKVRALMEYGY